MKAPADPRERKRLLGLAALLVVASGLAAVSYWPSDSGASSGLAPSDRARLVRPGASSVDPDAVPKLHIETERGPMDGEIVRNVFRFHDTPTPTPTHTLTPTVTPILPGSPKCQCPMPLTPTPTLTPIIPPQVPYKALGLIGERENPIVVLEDAGRLINARRGDILDGRFKIEKINRESVDFSFPPLPSHITRRIPLPVTAAP